MAVAIDTNGELLVGVANVPSGDFTASFWYAVNTDRANYVVVWAIGGNTANDTNAFVLWQNQGAANDPLELYSPLGAATITGMTLDITLWHYIAIVGNTGASQAWAVWVDGTKYTGTSGGSGGYADGAIDLMGSADEVSLACFGRVAAYKHWSAKLTDADVQAERWCYLPRRMANLWSFAPLTRSSVLEDFSGQAHGFTATGSLHTEEGPAIAWAPQGITRYRKKVSAASYTLVADGAALGLTGAAATLRVTLPSAGVGIGFTGADVTPRVTAALGSQAVGFTGQAVIPRVAVLLGSQAVGFTGTAATLTVTESTVMAAEGVALGFTGQAATLRVTLPVEGAAVGFTGQAVIPRVTLLLGSQAVGFTGTAAALLAAEHLRLTMDGAALGFTGQDVTLGVALSSVNDPVGFTGSPLVPRVTLPSAGVGIGFTEQAITPVVTLLAAGVALGFTGKDVTLTAIGDDHRLLIAEGAALGFTGLGIIPRVTLPTTGVAFGFTGQVVIPRVTLLGAGGVVGFTGKDATLVAVGEEADEGPGRVQRSGGLWHRSSST